MIDKILALYNLNTDKEKIREYLKQEAKTYFSEEGIEKLLNPKDTVSYQRIAYYIDYETGEFKTLSFSVVTS